FRLDAELPAPLAQCGTRERVVAAGAGAQLDAGEAVRGVLLPIPVVRQAAEQRLAGRLRRRAPLFHASRHGPSKSTPERQSTLSRRPGRGANARSNSHSSEGAAILPPGR